MVRIPVCSLNVLLGNRYWAVSDPYRPNLTLQRPKLHFGALSVAMTETDTKRYRKQAEECRKLAKKSANQFDKKSWLLLADDWIKLAEADEERRAKFGPRQD
jgi:hypothetical protein